MRIHRQWERAVVARKRKASSEKAAARLHLQELSKETQLAPRLNEQDKDPHAKEQESVRPSHTATANPQRYAPDNPTHFPCLVPAGAVGE